MRICAVVLNYRTAAHTVRTVEALRASTRAPDRVIVVDNDSRDGSDRHLREHLGGVTVIRSSTNLGFSGGCNLGIRRAMADGAGAVFLVNSDAIVAPGCLSALCAALDDPRVGIAGPVILDGTGLVESMGIRYSPATGRMRLQGHGERLEPTEATRDRRVDAVSAAVMLVRREVFERIGLFMEEFFYSFEDLDLCLRARAAGLEVSVAGDARATHSGSLSIGQGSTRQLYFAARNHLLVASRGARTGPRYAALLGSIVLLNLAHAAFRANTPPLAGVCAVLRGTRDHLNGRYGADA